MLSTSSSASSKLEQKPSLSPKKLWFRAKNATFFVTTVERKLHHIDSSSGEPQTHPSLSGEGVTCPEKVDLELKRVFMCESAVDVAKLLRLSRAELFERARLWNANVLVNEQWHSTICGPKHRKDGSFKVQIRYSASASRSSMPDPQKPVAIDKVKSVPGLMTIKSTR